MQHNHCVVGLATMFNIIAKYGMQIDFSKGGGEEAFISTCVLNVIEIKFFYAIVSTLVCILFQSILTYCFFSY